MRPTPAAHGIKGIFPLLKKECPQVFHPLPSLAHLSSYRLAIDATLLVQRFHFSPNDTHPARHLIGFHRLITTLRSHDVFPIFVFDHLTSRLAAKQREADKRREMRRVTRGRMRAEERRQVRLGKLRGWLRSVQALQEEERERVREILGRAREVDEQESGGDTGTAAVVEDDPSWLPFEEVQGVVDQGPSLESLTERNARLLEAAASEAPSSSSSFFYEDEDKSRQRSMALGLTVPQASPTPRDLAIQFEWLQQDYWRSAALPSSRLAAYGYTPTQLKMDEFEGKLYEYLAHSDLVLPAEATVESLRDAVVAKEQQEQEDGEVAPTPPTTPSPPVPTLTSTDLTTIETRTRLLSASYARSSSPLSSTIFDDCAHLCRLLSCPVLHTGSGNPHGGAKGEAEALAASLVERGMADLVATEDSDVLLAEVPLLRGLTGGKKGLEVVDSRGARRALFPPKSAPPAGEVKARVGKGSMAAATAPSSPSAAESSDTSSPTDATAATEAAAAARADKLSRYAMLEFALLCGTDYNRTITGLGSRGALKLLREHGGTIRGILRATGAAAAAAVATTGAGGGAANAGEGVQVTPTPSVGGKTLSPPDGLTWKEYGAELSRARAVFRNPPDALRALRLAGVEACARRDESIDVEAAAESSRPDGKLSIPPPPEVPLMERLASLAAAGTAGKSTAPDDENVPVVGRRRFPIPEYDGRAVSDFLRARGLGTNNARDGVEAVVANGGQIEAEADGNEQPIEVADRSALKEAAATSSFWPGTSTTSTSTSSTEGGRGFGKAFGGEVAARRFAFDR